MPLSLFVFYWSLLSIYLPDDDALTVSYLPQERYKRVSLLTLTHSCHDAYDFANLSLRLLTSLFLNRFITIIYQPLYFQCCKCLSLSLLSIGRYFAFTKLMTML